MQIEKLIVRETYPVDKIIRDITFKKNQLNLIVDVTKDIPQESGNSVGKTTTVRIIDLCLGASSVNSLYKDNDTKSENLVIKEYLKESKVTAELVLSENDNEVSITRELYPKGKKYINDIEYIEADFKIKLKEILFNSTTPKPTIRQLLKRFIRLENKQLENVIQYLDGANSKEIYESIHLSLLNVVDQNVLSNKMEYDKLLRESRSDLDKYMSNNNIVSLESLNQKLGFIDKELNEKLEQRKKIDYIDDYKEELSKRSEVLNFLDQIFAEIENLKFDISITEKSLESIKEDRTNIDTNELRRLYNEVSEKVKVIDKQFEELIAFHESMINNRISFIQEQLSRKKESLDGLLLQQEDLLSVKQELSKNLVDDNLLSDLNAINNKIDKLNIQKGEINNQITSYNNYYDKIELFIGNLKNLESINGDKVKEKIDRFNDYFSKYSKILYGEDYFLVYNKDWVDQKKGSLANNPFVIDNVSGNVGTGKKRGLIIAFDLAYLDYISSENIKAPQFIIHDKLENTHINQLDTIFNLCTNIKGQYIVPILKERISKINEEVVEQATILELSQESKFFKI